MEGKFRVRKVSLVKTKGKGEETDAHRQDASRSESLKMVVIWDPNVSSIQITR